MGLRLKYNLVLLLACLLGIGAATGISYFIVQKSAVEEIRQSINIVRANALAVRSYTVDHIDPLMSENNDILFSPETVTSFAARTVFARFQKQFPEFSYKEAALNPLNPADLSDDFETKLINQFRDDPSKKQIATVINSDKGRFLTVAFPMTITKKGCLACHGSAETAPPALVDLYGDKHGYGWKMGETVGAQIISAPMSIADKRAKETGLILISGLTLVFILVFIMTNVMLSLIVLRPVRRMSAVAEKVSMGDFSVPEYKKPGKDEISSLSVSFNRMRRSLERAMGMLDE